MVAIETRRGFLRLLREDAEFKSEVRRLILTEELLAMPKELAKMGVRIDSLEGRMKRLEDDLGVVKGAAVQLQMKSNIVSIFSTKMELRRGTLVKGAFGASTPTHDFDDAIYDAFDQGAITERQRGRVNDTDAVIRAICRKTGLRIYVAIEASFVIDDGDVDRAYRTSKILSKVFPGDLTASAVYGESINAEGSDMANDLDVIVHLTESALSSS